MKFLIFLLFTIHCSLFTVVGQSFKVPVPPGQQSNGSANSASPNPNPGPNPINNYYKYNNSAPSQNPPPLSTNNYQLSANFDYSQDVLKRLNANDFVGARADYLKLLAANPNNPYTHFNFALLIIEHFNDISLAQQHFQAAISLYPNEPRFHLVYATVLKIFYYNPTAATAQYILATQINPSLISPNADKFFGVVR